MSNQKGKHKECGCKSEVDIRIEKIRAELEEILERLGQNQRRIFGCWFQAFRFACCHRHSCVKGRSDDYVRGIGRLRLQ